MQAIEFHSIIKDGFIRIPDEYRAMLHSPVRVIVLKDEDVFSANDTVASHRGKKKTRPDRKKQVKFTDFGLEMPADYGFDREEANAR